MSTTIFCRNCQKKTEHDHFTDVWGQGSRSGFAERMFLGLMTLGASEAMADRRYECQECGRRTKA